MNILTMVTSTVCDVWQPQRWILHNSMPQHASSSLTAVLPPPGQHCGTVCLNSFGNWTSPSDNLNDCRKRLCLVTWIMASALDNIKVKVKVTPIFSLFTFCNTLQLSKQPRSCERRHNILALRRTASESISRIYALHELHCIALCYTASCT